MGRNARPVLQVLLSSGALGLVFATQRQRDQALGHGWAYRYSEGGRRMEAQDVRRLHADERRGLEHPERTLACTVVAQVWP